MNLNITRRYEDKLQNFGLDDKMLDELMDKFVEMAKNALTTNLPTPIHGHPLNSLRFTTVPTAPTAA